MISRVNQETSRTERRKKEYWKGIQAIFQDPFASYNMFKRVDSVLLDCINMRGDKKSAERRKRTSDDRGLQLC